MSHFPPHTVSCNTNIFNRPIDIFTTFATNIFTYLHPQFQPQYRNIEDLATAQAILDLSAPHRTLPGTAPPLAIAPPPHLGGPPPPPGSPDFVDIKTEDETAEAGASAVFKINGGRTTAYTYEVPWIIQFIFQYNPIYLQAFFASDGRSKKQQPLLEDTKPKYTCTECGKNYATSSNLSRHRQTHRTLDSTNAKKCPICNKVW